MHRSSILMFFSVALAVGSPSLATESGEREPDTRQTLRRSAGELEARAADTRAFVRANANERGAELEAARAALMDERIPALQRDLDALRAAVEALRDGELRGGLGGIELSVDSCWPKSKRWLAADKYLFRASVRVDEGSDVRAMAIREPSNGDVDGVRIPPASARDDGKAGTQYEIYDSFKIWGHEAELVVEDGDGAEHVLLFDCN